MALASNAAALGSIVWAALLFAFVLCSVALLGLVVRLHRLVRGVSFPVAWWGWM